jgi:hypothetical protein
MALQEMAQNGDKLGGVLYAALIEGLMDILNDHGSDSISATRLVEQVARQCGRRDVSNMLVLADRGHLLGIQAAHCNAVF